MNDKDEQSSISANFSPLFFLPEKIRFGPKNWWNTPQSSNIWICHSSGPEGYNIHIASAAADGPKSVKGPSFLGHKERKANSDCGPTKIFEALEPKIKKKGRTLVRNFLDPFWAYHNREDHVRQRVGMMFICTLYTVILIVYIYIYIYAYTHTRI